MFQEKSQFQARSGRTIKVGEDGTLIFDHVHGYLDPDSAMDAEEYHQAKRDEELGRWRWPENPDFVVYPNDGDVIWTVDEVTGVSHMNTREGLQPDQHGAAARAYFEAHPERKPWHDAKPGQVWALRTLDSMNGAREEAWQITDRRDEFWSLGLGYLPLTSRHIVGGRRIWPEDAS